MDKPIGYKHYRWTVIGEKVVQGKRGFYPCVCECGTNRMLRSDHLLADDIRSCGCNKREVQTARLTKHGHALNNNASPTYTVWEDMRQRVYNPNHKAYKDYGGRGITVCPEWEDFAVFLKDMGERPHVGMSLDRIDSNGGYSKYNCKWSTRAQQNRNYSKKSVYHSYAGLSLIQKDWSNMFGVGLSNFRRWMLKDGLSIEEIAAKAIASGRWDGQIDYSYLRMYNQYENDNRIPV